MRATVTALTSMALSLAACLSTASFAQNIENIEGAKKSCGQDHVSGGR